MQIFIPTRGRINNQVTFERFHLAKSLYPVTFIVPEEEYHGFVSKWGTQAEIRIVPSEWHIGNIHDYIASYWGDKKHVVIDDDCKLYHCPSKKSCLIVRHARQARNMFLQLEKALDTFAYAGLTPSGYHTLSPFPSYVNSRVLNFHAYRRDIIVKEGIKWRLPTSGDQHAVLTTLELGYAVHLTNRWCVQAANWQPGGCTEYRTAELADQSFQTLAKLHSKVKLRKSTTATDQQTLDVRVQWKKSYGIRKYDRKLKRPGVEVCD